MSESLGHQGTYLMSCYVARSCEFLLGLSTLTGKPEEFRCELLFNKTLGTTDFVEMQTAEFYSCVMNFQLLHHIFVWGVRTFSWTSRRHKTNTISIIQGAQAPKGTVLMTEY